MDNNSDRFVTWHEGAKELNVSKGIFFYEVRSGRIKEDPTRKARDGKYSWASIQDAKAKRDKSEKYKPRKRHQPVKYDWISARDIPVVLLLDQARYTREDTDWQVNYNEVAEYQARYNKNPQIAMGAWSLDRRECLGYVSLYPVLEPVSLSVLAGQRDELSITLDEIEAYDRPGAYTLHCLSMVAKEGHEYVLTGILGRYIDWWVEQYPTRFITRVYAQTVSQHGIGVVRHLFLQPLAGYPDNAYYLDMARFNPSRVIQQFIARLEAKAPLPVELTTRYTPPLPSQLVARHPASSSPVVTPTIKRPVRTARPDLTGSDQAGYNAIVIGSSDDLPEGSILLETFALQIGINRSTLLGHLKHHGIEHYAIPKTATTSTRFISPEQASIIRQWQQRNWKEA